MNTLRIWLLVAGSIAASGANAYKPGLIQNEIIAESSQKTATGRESMDTGFLLLAAALMMNGITGLLQKKS